MNGIDRPERKVYLAAAFLILVAAGVTLSLFSRPRVIICDDSPVGRVRALNTAEMAYSYTYPEIGFSPSLAALGPPPVGRPPSAEAADLIEAELASGTRYQFYFEYKPGPKDKDGTIQSYSIVAFPQDWQEGKKQSFFTDQTGVIRGTRENRKATKYDPPI